MPARPMFGGAPSYCLHYFEVSSTRTHRADVQIEALIATGHAWTKLQVYCAQDSVTPQNPQTCCSSQKTWIFSLLYTLLIQHLIVLTISAVKDCFWTFGKNAVTQETDGPSKRRCTVNTAFQQYVIAETTGQYNINEEMEPHKLYFGTIDAVRGEMGEHWWMHSKPWIPMIQRSWMFPEWNI